MKKILNPSTSTSEMIEKYISAAADMRGKLGMAEILRD
jgi:hypothetical protein